MRILGGDELGLLRAAQRIESDPNPEHLREDYLMTGVRRNISDIVAESLSNSSIAAYAMDGESAVLCGLGILGFTRFQIWMAATNDTTERPLWLLKQMRRLLALGDAEMFKGAMYWQVIPPEYERGLNFVQHLGFVRKGMWQSPLTGNRFILVEREVE